MSLNEQQKIFIQKKIKQLGNPESVYAFYDLKDEVSEYAHSLVGQRVKRRNIDIDDLDDE